MKAKQPFGNKFVIIMALLVGSFTILSSSNSVAGIGLDNPTTAPTAPLAPNAIFQNDQVNLSWQPSQPGRFNLSLYNVFRKSAGDQDFQEIAQVEVSSTTYTDSQGKLGDRYVIEATDDQDPSNTSPESDEAVAKELPVTDESSATVSSSLPAVETATVLQDITTGVSKSEAKVPAVVQPTALAHISLPRDNVAGHVVDQINHMGDVHLVQLEQAVRSSRSDLIIPVLAQYNYEKQQLYQRFGVLSDTDKANAKTTCNQQTQDLETNLLNLPEGYQMNGLLALAYCDLIGSHP